MRTGLLTRFWGSLGMALGAASFIFFQFALLWFVYLGLLLLGWRSRRQPPAWAAGEAIPWPTPGEKAAAELEPETRGWRGPGSLERGATRRAERRTAGRPRTPTQAQASDELSENRYWDWPGAARLRWVRISLRIRSRRGSCEVST